MDRCLIRPDAKDDAIAEESVGFRVLQARLERKATQAEVAAHLGIVPQQIFKYERGLNRIPATRLFQIAEFLDADVEWLLTGQNPEERRRFESLARDELTLLQAFRQIRCPELRNAALTLVCGAASSQCSKAANEPFDVVLRRQPRSAPKLSL